MNPILVTGGTGHLGRDLVAQLLSQHRPVRVFARQPGKEADVEWALGDLATGAGVRQALQGIESVIHAATLSPIARRGAIRPTDLFSSPTQVDIEGTRRLLQERERAGVAHFLFVSIVGLDGASLPYAKVKLASEKLVRRSALPWSVVRATPFYYLSECSRAFDGCRFGPCRTRHSTPSIRRTFRLI